MKIEMIVGDTNRKKNSVIRHKAGEENKKKSKYQNFIHGSSTERKCRLRTSESRPPYLVVPTHAD
jgi:hypothetical protein